MEISLFVCVCVCTRMHVCLRESERENLHRYLKVQCKEVKIQQVVICNNGVN